MLFAICVDWTSVEGGVREREREREYSVVESERERSGGAQARDKCWAVGAKKKKKDGEKIVVVQTAGRAPELREKLVQDRSLHYLMLN